MSLQNLALCFYENRDQRSFNLVYNRIKPGLINYLLKNCGCKDTQTCEHVISRTFSRVWEKIEQYNPYYNFSTWVYRIARNEAMQLIRDNNRERYYIEKMKDIGLLEDSKYEPDYEYFDSCYDDNTYELFDKVIETANMLPDKYRIVFLDYYVQNYKEREIAERHNININTVKTWKKIAKDLVFTTIKDKHSEMVDKFKGL